MNLKSLHRTLHTFCIAALLALVSACGGSTNSTVEVDSDAEIIIGRADDASIGAGGLQISPGSLQSLSATFIDGNASSSVTSDALWASSDLTVADVSNGSILGVAPGSAIISATYNGETASLIVTVSIAGTLNINPSTLVLAVSEQSSLIAQYTPEGGIAENVSLLASWSVSPNSGLLVARGNISALEDGTYIVTASYNGAETSALVEVGDTHLTCSMDQNTYEINLVDGISLSATCIESGQSSNVSNRMQCVTSDSSIAEVNGTNVIGRADGSVTITCEVDGTSFSTSVTVDAITCTEVGALTVSADTNMIDINQTLQLAATYRAPCANASQTVSPIWSVDLGGIETNGLYTPSSTGNVVITATHGGLTGSFSIEVTEPGVLVYFKKPADWTAVNVYSWFFAEDGASPEQAFGAWPGAAMNPVEGDWYNAFVPSTDTANFVFNEGLDKRQTGNLEGITGGWYDGQQNKWLTASPFGLGVDASPCDVSFSGPNLTLNLSLSGNGASGQYTISGSAGQQDVGFSQGDSVTIDGSGLDTGDAITLNATASDSKGGSASLTCTYTKAKQAEMTGRLGAVYSAQSTTFSIWSPDAGKAVGLDLAGESFPMIKAPEAEGYSNVYSVTVPGDHHLKEYNFTLNGRKVRDPYGVMVVPGTDTNVVLDLSRTEPAGGWAPLPALIAREDAVIYEVHVRDFTIHQTSGVSAQNSGKFLGMVEQGTSHQGAKTGIDHLLELGVTHVQILPFYDYGTCSEKEYSGYSDSDGCYNWGYDPENFNIPEERYAVDRHDYEGRVRELKEMINEFHKHGIRVIMDVVYNHSWSGNAHSGGETTFGPITMDYFWPSDLSGTGNALDPRNPMVSRFIRDSLEYWVSEYNLDGFRFDLVGIFDHEEFGAWANYLNTKYAERNLLVYGEPWNGFATDSAEADRVRMGTIGIQYQSHVGVFNGKFRDAIKGNLWSGEIQTCGFMTGNGSQSGEIQTGVRGAIRPDGQFGEFAVDTWASAFANDPEQSINYVAAHDNYGLRDHAQRSFDFAGGGNCDPGFALSEEHHKRIAAFANAMVLTAQGIPFIHAGSEMFRTKLINGDWHTAENSYKSSDAVNAINWAWKVENQGMVQFHADLINMRRSHPGFRMNTWDEVNSNVITGTASGRNDVVITDINAAANGDSWQRIIMIYNAGEDYAYSLPAGNWKLAVSGQTGGLDTVVSETHIAEGSAVTVIYQE